jgi:hypothetical protein
LIDAKITQVPSVSLSRRLARLPGGATKRQNKKANNIIFRTTLYTKNETLFIMSPLKFMRPYVNKESSIPTDDTVYIKIRVL